MTAQVVLSGHLMLLTKLFYTSIFLYFYLLNFGSSHSIG